MRCEGGKDITLTSAISRREATPIEGPKMQHGRKHMICKQRMQLSGDACVRSVCARLSARTRMSSTPHVRSPAMWGANEWSSRGSSLTPLTPPTSSERAVSTPAAIEAAALREQKDALSEREALTGSSNSCMHLILGMSKQAHLAPCCAKNDRGFNVVRRLVLQETKHEATRRCISVAGTIGPSLLRPRLASLSLI